MNLSESYKNRLQSLAGIVKENFNFSGPKEELLSLESKYPNIIKVIELKPVPLSGYICKIQIDGNVYDCDIDNNIGEWEYFIINYPTINSTEDVNGTKGFKGNIMDIEEDLIKELL